MKKKVVFLIHSLMIGGSENLFLQIIPNIKDADITLVTLYHKGPLYKKYLNSGIKVMNIGQKSFFDLKSYRRAKNIFDKIKPELVITNLFHADFFGRFYIQYILKYPTVPYLVSTLSFNRYLPIRIFERFTKHLVPYYIANSNAVKNSYIKNYHIKSNRITVIQNGLDLERFNTNVNDQVKKSIGILPNHQIITCVANFHISKGQIFLIDAFNQLANKYKIQLLLVGDGVTRLNLEKYADTLPSKNKIKFLGTRGDVPEILKLSDIFVLPTFFEGLSVAIMEAMASKLAIITTDIPENKELIKNNYSGLLCPVGDPDCLAKKIEYLVTSKTRLSQLANNAQFIIKKKFQLSVITQKWSKYFKNYEKNN